MFKLLYLLAELKYYCHYTVIIQGLSLYSDSFHPIKIFGPQVLKFNLILVRSCQLLLIPVCIFPIFYFLFYMPLNFWCVPCKKHVLGL